MSFENLDPRDQLSLRELMEGLETTINEDAASLLKKSPIEVSVHGLQTDRKPSYVSSAELDFAHAGRDDLGEFQGIDIETQLNIDCSSDIKRVVLNWSNDNSVVAISDLPTRIYVIFQAGNRTVHQEIFSGPNPDNVWLALGVPGALLSGPVSKLENILESMNGQYQSVDLNRSRTIAINPYTEVQLGFSSHIAKEYPETTEEYNVSNEYSIKLMRWDSYSTNLGLPPTYQNEIVLHPNEKGRFSYSGNYNSPLVPGELPGEVNKKDTMRKVIPDIRLLQQAVETLSEVSFSESRE